MSKVNNSISIQIKNSTYANITGTKVFIEVLHPRPPSNPTCIGFSHPPYHPSHLFIKGTVSCITRRVVNSN